MNNMYPYLPNYIGPSMQIQKVNGEESAKNYPMGPNSSAILLDANDPLIWVVVTDASGYKTINPFTITPYIPEQPVTTADLSDKIGSIIDRLDKIEERMSYHGQSNYGSSRENKSGNAGTQSNGRNGKSFAESTSSN